MKHFLYVTATGQAEAAFAGPDGKKKNSAKHAAWNCFGIRNIILTGVFKDPAITYVRKGTSAHEKTPTGGQNRRLDNLMDLNSNMVGRSWMDSNTSWGLGPLRFMPNELAINAHMNNLANNGPKITYDWHVLDRYPPGGLTAWDILYESNTGPNPYLMYLVD